MRPSFLTSPGTWLHSRRIAQSEAEYAEPISRYRNPVRLADRICSVVLAVAIGAGLSWAVIVWCFGSVPQ